MWASIPNNCPPLHYLQVSEQIQQDLPLLSGMKDLEQILRSIEQSLHNVYVFWSESDEDTIFECQFFQSAILPWSAPTFHFAFFYFFFCGWSLCALSDLSALDLRIYFVHVKGPFSFTADTFSPLSWAFFPLWNIVDIYTFLQFKAL